MLPSILAEDSHFKWTKKRGAAQERRDDALDTAKPESDDPRLSTTRSTLFCRVAIILPRRHFPSCSWTFPLRISGPAGHVRVDFRIPATEIEPPRAFPPREVPILLC